jgi:hypothetical protein
LRPSDRLVPADRKRPAADARDSRPAWFDGAVISPRIGRIGRLLVAVAALALVMTACGGDDTRPTDSTTVSSANPQIGGAPPTSTPEGYEIPSVTFTLSDGTSFDLAAAGTPVMMVFWAEW